MFKNHTFFHVFSSDPGRGGSGTGTTGSLPNPPEPLQKNLFGEQNRIKNNNGVFTENGSGDTEGDWFWKSGCLWMLPVCSGCRISRYSEKSQNPEVVISPRKRFSQKWCFYGTKTTNRKDGNDRKDHEKISCFHQNLILWWYLLIKLMFFTKTRIFVFLYG